MKTRYQIDLSRIPDTFDLVHVGLLVMVLVLFLMLFIVTLLLLLNFFRQRKQASASVQVVSNQAQAEPLAVSSVEPEVKIVEKVVEKIIPGPTPEPVIIKEITADAATQLLSLLQKEARFIDFINEDISRHQDADIGVIARVVHEGCAKVIKQNFNLSPIRQESENSQITIDQDFDANLVRLTGNIVGKPPFTGILVHKGWQVSAIRLPKITQGHNVNIIAPAEVEL